MSDKKERNYRRTIALILIIILAVANYVDRAILTPNSKYILMDLLGYTAEQAATSTAKIDGLHTAFKWTSAAFTIIYGYLNDKYPRKMILVMGAIAYGICSIITSYITSYGQLVAMQMITAVSIGASLPTSYSILSDLYPPEKRSRVFGYFGISTIFGDIIGSVLVSIVYPIDPLTYTPLENWRTPFMIVGILTIVGAALIFFIVEEPKRGSTEHYLDEILSTESINYSYRIQKEDLKNVWKKKTNFWLILNFVDNIMGGYILAKAIPWLTEEHGAAPEVAGMLILIPATAILIGTILGGHLGDKLYKNDKRGRVKIAIIGLGMSIVIIPIALTREFSLKHGDGTYMELGEVLGYTPFLVAFMLFFVYFIFNNMVGPNWHSIIIDANKVETRGSMLSIAVFFEEFGEGLGILIGALIHDSLAAAGSPTPFGTTFLILTAFNVAGLLMWFPIYKNIKSDIEEVEKIHKQHAEELKKA